MPWQQHVADVALEIDPLTGRLAYDELGLTVPRQSGKSTWVLAKATHRASATDFFGPKQRIVYTAQTRNKAREKWEEDYADELAASRAFRSRVTVHKGNGNEHVRFSNRSRFGIEANTEKAGHGGTLDEAYIDEAFSQPDGRLEQAFSPAMITRANKLLAWISTAGWLGGSPYLEGKVRAGRTQAEMGVREGLAYFEWSAPEGCDPGDPAVWRACMPALGHTITEAAIRAEFDKAMREDKLADFQRAYLNLWVPKPSPRKSEGLDLAQWNALAAPPGERGSPAFGVAVAPDHSWSAIAVAWKRPDGAMHVELADYREGDEWLDGRLAELRAKWGGEAVGNAASRGLAADVRVPGEQEQAQAHNEFDAALARAAIRHSDQRALQIAVGAAVWKPQGNTRALDPKGSTDISPLLAAALAVHGLTTTSTTGGWVLAL